MKIRGEGERWDRVSQGKSFGRFGVLFDRNARRDERSMSTTLFHILFLILTFHLCDRELIFGSDITMLLEAKMIPVKSAAVPSSFPQVYDLCHDFPID